MAERTGHHRGGCRARQSGSHAKAVEGAQGGQGRRGHQGAIGDVPQVAAQHLRGEDGAGVDLDVVQRTRFGEGHPARHGRAVFRILAGKGRPQFPVALGTRQQTAEQRIPLLGLVAGQADAGFAVHGLLEHLGQAGEEVGELGEAFLELDTHFPQVFGDHPADESVPRPLAAFHVLARAEIRQRLAGGKHELLLGADLPRQFRHLLHQPAEIARQGVLGKELGEVLGDLLQPLGGGSQPGEMGEVADGLVRQVVAFVEHIEGVAGIGQDGAAAQGQVGQHQVMVGDDDVDLGHAFARLVESTLLEIRAMAIGALAVVGGDARPLDVLDGFRPAVAIAVPAIAGQALDHLAEQLVGRLVHIDLEAILGEQLGRGVLRLALLQQHVQLGQAQIAPPPLGQGKAEGQAAVAQDVRQILVHDLLLQRHRRRGDHQALAGRLGRGNGRQGIGHGLAGPGARLHRHHCRLAFAMPLLVLGDGTQALGGLRDHQPLAIAWLERLGFEETRIGALDLGLEFGAEHAWFRAMAKQRHVRRTSAVCIYSNGSWAL